MQMKFVSVVVVSCVFASSQPKLSLRLPSLEDETLIATNERDLAQEALFDLHRRVQRVDFLSFIQFERMSPLAPNIELEDSILEFIADSLEELFLRLLSLEDEDEREAATAEGIDSIRAQVPESYLSSVLFEAISLRSLERAKAKASAPIYATLLKWTMRIQDLAIDEAGLHF